MFTKTETLTRLRQAAKDARWRAGVHARCKAEVGLRIDPQVRDRVDPETPLYPEVEDDLDYTVSFDEAAGEPAVRAHGALVHVYLVGNPIGFGEWELSDTAIVWLGTPDAPPRVLDLNGRRLDGGVRQ